MKTETKNELDAVDRLTRMKGFDPSTQIEWCTGCFTFEDAQESLFRSTKNDPRTVTLTSFTDTTQILVVLDLARPLFNLELIGQREIPHWYFEGVIFEDNRHRPPVTGRVRVYVETSEPYYFDVDDVFAWQEIKEAVPKRRGLRKWGREVVDGFTIYMIRRNMY